MFDMATLKEVAQFFALVLLVIVGIASTIGLLALVVFAANKLKTEGQKLAGKYPGVLSTIELAADFDVSKLESYVDDPNDMIIMLLAQALKGDPKLIIERIDQGLDVLAKIQDVWPDLKDKFGIVTPETFPATPETAPVEK